MDLRQHTQRRRGMTMLEVLIVIAILGIIGALAVGIMNRMTPRANFSSNSAEIVGSLAEAQGLALATQRNVWLMVFISTANSADSGFLIYEDPDGDFDFASYGPSGSGSTATFAVQETGDRIVASRYFREPPFDGKIRFATSGTTFKLTAPFSTDVTPCSFCTSSGGFLKGAVVFEPSGETRFIAADGTDSDARIGVLGLTNTDGTERAGIGIASASGMVRLTKGSP